MTEGENEASRRVKTEFLVQMNGKLESFYKKISNFHTTNKVLDMITREFWY